MDFFSKEEWEKDPDEDLKKPDKPKEKVENNPDEILAEEAGDRTDEENKETTQTEGIFWPVY
jgi:hypothetical protein